MYTSEGEGESEGRGREGKGTEREREGEGERLTSSTYSAPVSLKSMPPIVKVMGGRDLIFEQSIVYCMRW